MLIRKRTVRTRITSKGQTTVPSSLRNIWKARDVAWEFDAAGNATVRPLPTIDELFGSVKNKKGYEPSMVEEGWNARADELLKKSRK